jgi:hypothetical protein
MLSLLILNKMLLNLNSLLYSFTSIVILFSLFVYFYYKLTFWKRQKIPNILLHSLRAFVRPSFSVDQECIQKYGNVFGLVFYLDSI